MESSLKGKQHCGQSHERDLQPEQAYACLSRPIPSVVSGPEWWLTVMDIRLFRKPDARETREIKKRHEQ